MSLHLCFKKNLFKWYIIFCQLLNLIIPPINQPRMILDNLFSVSQMFHLCVFSGVLLYFLCNSKKKLYHKVPQSFSQSHTEFFFLERINIKFSILPIAIGILILNSTFYILNSLWNFFTAYLQIVLFLFLQLSF